jgi:hypothetical protein
VLVLLTKRSSRRRLLSPSAASLETRAAAGGAQDRGDGVGVTLGVPRSCRTGGRHATTPLSILHQQLRENGTDAVLTASKSKKKPATTASDRDDA